MLAKLSWGLLWGAIVVSCFAGHSRKAAAANCALYARAITGVDLHGAAGGWWDQAAGRYGRGPTPAVGSILVFRRTRRIPSGHVAVVSKVVSPGEVLVDHANWYHGAVSHDMPVIDTSPNHDWTIVAAVESSSGHLGSNYPTYGFVYPQSGPRALSPTVSIAGFDPNTGATADALGPSGLFHFTIDEEALYFAAHSRNASHRRRRRHSTRSAVRGRGRVHAGALRARHAAPPHASTRTAGLHRHSDRATRAG
jgi:surface antigen